MVAIIAVTVWLIMISIFDIRTRKIPVWMLMAGCVCAAPILAVRWSGGVVGYGDVLKGMLPGVLLLVAALGTKKVGYGDGAVLLLLGTAVGGPKSWMLFGISLFFISGFSLALLALKKVKGRTKIPYLPFLAAAWMLVVMG